MARDRDLRGVPLAEPPHDVGLQGQLLQQGPPFPGRCGTGQALQAAVGHHDPPSWSTTSSSQAPVSWEGFEHQVAWPQLEQDDDLRGQGLQLADHGCAETSWVPIHHAQAG